MLCNNTLYYVTIRYITLQVIKTQLKERHKTLEDAMIEARDRVKWRAIVQDQSFLASNGQQ